MGGIIRWLLGKTKWIRPPAPVVKDVPGVDRDYRFASDEEYVIRIEQERPKGLPKKIANFVSVAGVTYREDNVIAFIQGTNRRLELRREPDNPQSKTAIMVIGHFTLNGRENSLHLGYLPHEVSQEIAKEYPDKSLGATLERMFMPKKGQSPGLRIDVWGPRSASKK